MLSRLTGNCNPAENAEDCLSLVFSFEETSRRKCCDCSANAHARTEAHKSGFTDAPHYDCRDWTPSRHAIMQDFSPSVITTILVNGREPVQQFSAVVPRNEQHRISTDKSRRITRRVAGGARFVCAGHACDDADASNHYFGLSVICSLHPSQANSCATATTRC